jgi:hypothetical protein
MSMSAEVNNSYTHDCVSDKVLVKSSSMVKFTSDRHRTKALATSHELAVLVIIKRCTCILGMAVAQKVWYDINTQNTDHNTNTLFLVMIIYM